MLNPPTSCCGSNSSLTSSTGTRLSRRYVNSLTVSALSQIFFFFHCLSNISFTCSACKISLKLWSYDFNHGTSIVDPLTTLYTQYCISLYFQAADPTWVIFTFRHAIFCDHYLSFSMVNFEILALKSLCPF